ncbi:MAG: SHOCT-like domain-containing protein [Aggregatilineales bacterium]
MTQTIPVAADGRITVAQVGADLQIRGWARNEVQVDGDLPRVKTEAEGQGVMISTGGDCELNVPENAKVEVGTVGADVKLSDVHGEVKLNTVGADVALRGCGNLTIGTVGADVRVRQNNGDVRIDSVGADVTLHEISGNVAIGRIGADAYVRAVSGDCVIERVGADLILDTPFTPGHTYRFAAMSDIVCRIAPDADVQFIITGSGDVNVEAVNANTTQTESDRRVTFGQGTVTVMLSSESGVRIVNERGFGEGFGGFDFAFDWAFDHAFEHSAQAAERIGERIRRQAERAAERAAEQGRRQAERAAERAQREAERAQRHAQRHGRDFRFDWQWGGWGPRPPEPPMPPSSPRAPSEPVTDTERMTILKMVEAKQITVEEAQRLLAALEGR